nr:hypothetical protein GCM10025732_19990 [Glycomyces mayteni]
MNARFRRHASGAAPLVNRTSIALDQNTNSRSSAAKSARSDPSACARSAIRRACSCDRWQTSASRAVPGWLREITSFSARFCTWSSHTRSTYCANPSHGSAHASARPAAVSSRSSAYWGTTASMRPSRLPNRW